MAKVAEVYVGVTFKVTGQKDADRANTSTQSIARAAARAAAALTAMSVGFAMVARSAALAANEVSNFVLSTGFDGEGFQRMAFGAAQAGVAVNEVSGALKALQKDQVDLLMGTKTYTREWGFFGLDPNKDTPQEMLEKMRKKIQSSKTPGLDRTMFESMGFSENLFDLLRRVDGEIKSINESLVIPQKDLDSARELTSVWRRLSETLKLITTKFLSLFYDDLLKLGKVLQPIVDGFADLLFWLMKLPVIGPAIKSFFGMAVFMVMALAAAFTALAVGLQISKIVSALYLAIPAILSYAAAWGTAAAAAWAALVPFLPIIVAVVAALAVLGVIVQDVWTYFDGGKSVLGDIIELLKSVGDFFTATGDKAVAAFAKIKDFFIGYRKAGGVFGGLVGPLGGAVTPGMRGIGEVMKWLDGKGPAQQQAPVTINNQPVVNMTAPKTDDPTMWSEILTKGIVGGMVSYSYHQMNYGSEGASDSRE